MTAPVFETLKGPAMAPVSLGWIAAHAMNAGGTSANGWRAPLALARSAAAAMAGVAGTAGGSSESREADAGAEEFVKPFRAAAELMGLIREPLKPNAGIPQSGIGALAGTGLSALAALSGGDAEAMGAESGRLSDASGNTLSDALAGPSPAGPAIGATPGIASLDSKNGVAVFASLAANGVGPSRQRGPADGSWVETGNPTTRKGSRSAPPGRSPQSAKPSAAANPPRASFSPSAAPTLPPARTDFEVWAERAAGKLARYVSGTGSASGPGPGSGSAKPTSPKRAPFIPPEDPETIARFKKLMEANLPVPHAADSETASGSAVDGNRAKPAANGRETKPGQAPKAGDSGSDRMVPVSPPYAGNAGPSGPGNPPAPDLSDLADALYAPVRPAAPGTDGNVHSPVHSPSSARNPDSGSGRMSPSDANRIPPRSVVAPGSDPVRAPMPSIGNGATVQRNGQSQMEWMDEEDDLAAKLHRLLRRQAKRRGVELP
jgi:hypothetical protein